MSYNATISADSLTTKLSIITSCLLEQLSGLLGFSRFCTLLPVQVLTLNFMGFFSPVEPEADKTFQIIITTDHFAGPAACKTFHAFSL